MQEFSSNNKFNLVPALYVVATPIGNFGDITLRAINVLRQCDFVVCEDSRVTAKLLANLEIKKTFLVYNDHSDLLVREKILNLILQGKTLALVSDAGTPLISDPGYKLVAFLQENNCQVLSVPGACSAIAALSVAGIASNRFMFVGFVPSTAMAKENFFKDLLNIDSTLIFFETSSRLAKSLEVMLKVFGNRTACVSREITKIYEQTKKDYLQNLIDYYQQNLPRGEIVILLSPPPKKSEVNIAEIDKRLKQGLEKAMKPKNLVSVVAGGLGVNKKLVYQRMLVVIDGDR